jgi:transcriptional regulator with XRE-family HTH domain
MSKLKEIGRRVAKLRKQSGLTQEQFAAEIGLGRGTIAGIESGGDQAGHSSMVAIADYFKVPMDWLICREVPPGGPLLGQFIDRPDELAWVNFYRSLTPADRAAAVKLLRVPQDGRARA